MAINWHFFILQFIENHLKKYYDAHGCSQLVIDAMRFHSLSATANDLRRLNIDKHLTPRYRNDMELIAVAQRLTEDSQFMHTSIQYFWSQREEWRMVKDIKCNLEEYIQLDAISCTVLDKHLFIALRPLNGVYLEVVLRAESIWLTLTDFRFRCGS